MATATRAIGNGRTGVPDPRGRRRADPLLLYVLAGGGELLDRARPRCHLGLLQHVQYRPASRLRFSWHVPHVLYVCHTHAFGSQRARASLAEYAAFTSGPSSAPWDDGVRVFPVASWL